MREGIVFDIEHYAVHDGPGIRTVVFLKGCPLTCPWCCNPESQRGAPELRHTAARCRGCLACRDACPNGAVRVTDAAPRFDRQACGACGAPCVDACAHAALAITGERMTAGRVMARVAADKAFYDNSGGGVTFSGGEPFAQPAFLEQLLGESKRLGIHTAVETCGHADPLAVARCEPLVDLFLYDIKVADSARHERLTGVPNSLVRENLRTLAARAPGKIALRVPIVPGCTDDEQNLAAIAAIARSVGIFTVELMPYHALGADKYESLGRDYGPSVSPSLVPRAAEHAARLIRANGVECRVAGE
ncbi:MAG: glycyl-radical enzyme activating protein [Bacteroidales bacterium]